MAGDMEVPEGPVTVMFTDVEGSTAVRTTVGDGAADELFRAHDELIRAQIEAHRGHDLHAALGDGFLAVFVSTRRAIACAVGIQLALDELNRARSGPPLRVRIGLNTGEVAWHDGQLSGEAVHAAARVCAAATGGEVFVSDVTRQLAGTVPDVDFVDRGEFDLKGFPTAWRLWSLSWRAAATEPIGDVFVGREAELADLRRKLRLALDGQGSLVLIGGEPGVGKTTLVKQLIKEAEQQGAVALLGRCYESEGTVPYSPFVEATEQALRLVPPEWVREDLGETAGEVARMVPELRRRFPDIGEPLDLPPEQQRRYFFNAISEFLARSTARRPLVLVVDDVHWADEPTLLLVEHVASQIKDLRLLAIGTYRDIELDVSRPLAASLDRLLRGRLAERIGLRRFDRDGVARMLSAHGGQPAPDALVDAVFDETEGNPFFVAEVFRHLVEEGKVYDEAGAFRTEIDLDELDVPESVRLVVGRRVQRLGDDAQRVLAAGAVVGRGFEFGLLERISDVDPSTLLDIVDEAERARVIVAEERAGTVFYTFGHELIRQTLLSSLSLPRRQRMHLAVADAMEALDPETASLRPSELAHHLLQAGATADRKRTLAALVRTVDRAIEAAAFEEARAAAEEAIALATDDADLATRVALTSQLARTQRALGNFARGIELMHEAAEGYAELGDLVPCGHLYWQIGYLEVWMGRFDLAYVAYQRGLERIGDASAEARAILLGGRLSIEGFAGADVAEPFAEALALAEACGDDRCLGQVRWGQSVVYWSQARPAEAIVEGEAAIAHMRRAGDLWTLVDGLSWAAFPMLTRGQLDRARACSEEAVALGERVGHRSGAALGVRGLVLLEAIENPGVDTLFAGADEDQRRLEAVGSPWAGQSRGWRGAALLLAGRLDESLRETEAGMALEPESAWSGVSRGFWFLNRVMAGDRDACRAHLDTDLDALLAPRPVGAMGRVLQAASIAEGCALLGWRDEAVALAAVFEPYIEPLSVRAYDFALLARIAGMVAVVDERWDDAVRHFERALAQVDELSMRGDEPLVLHRYAEALARRGDPADRERARTMVGRAIDGYGEMGIVVYLPDAERLALSLR